MDFLVRLFSLVKKELLAVLRDKKSRMALIVPPMIQVCVFGYAATLNVTRVPYALLDHDRGELAARYIARLEGSGIFQRQASVQSEAQLNRLIDTREALLAITIPPDFSRNIQKGQPASLQVIADGRNSNTAAIALGYTRDIAAAMGADIAANPQTSASPQPPAAAGASKPARVIVADRAWYNPNLITRWFVVPGLIAVLSLINSVLAGSLSIAREREEGTFDQLLVAPYSPGQILLGKGLSAFLGGAFQATCITLLTIFWFKIPFNGSLPLLVAAIALFLVAAVSMGLCISAFSNSLQQSIVGTFLMVVPMVMLSGFATPISSMPHFFQNLTLLNPVRYGLELIQRIYLEGASFPDVWQLFAAILSVAVLSVLAAIFSFHHKMY